MRLEPGSDVLAALTGFNGDHSDHPLGLFLEGTARLGKGEREGLALLDRAMALDPEATKPACERVYAFLREHKDLDSAEAYAERWRRRDELETKRSRQLQVIDARHALAPHGLDAATIGAVKSRLAGEALAHIDAVYLARRVIPADPSAVQLVMGLHLSWWGRRRGKQRAVVKRLAAMEWPVPLVFVALDGQYAPMKKQFRSLTDAKLV